MGPERVFRYTREYTVFWAFVNSITNPKEIVSKVFFIVIILSFNQFKISLILVNDRIILNKFIVLNKIFQLIFVI